MSDDDSWHIRYNVMVAVRYHMHRQAFYDRIHRLVGIGSLLFSSAAVSALSDDLGMTKNLAAVVALLQCFDLVTNSKQKGDLHADLRRRYLRLESDIQAKRGNLTEWNDKLKMLEIDEPPIKRALMIYCENEVTQVTGAEFDDPPETLGWFKNLTKNWFTWSSEPKPKHKAAQP